jgi:hypothetical protein
MSTTRWAPIDAQSRRVTVTDAPVDPDQPSMFDIPDPDGTTHVIVDQPDGPVVFDVEEGRRLRDEGTEHAGDGAPAVEASAWKAEAHDALDALIKESRLFTADDIVALAGEPPEPNMLGGLFLRASQSKRIVAVGLRQSKRPKAHGRKQQTWMRNFVPTAADYANGLAE